MAMKKTILIETAVLISILSFGASYVGLTKHCNDTCDQNIDAINTINETNTAAEQISASLDMENDGYYDGRPEYKIYDLGYTINRDNNLPDYGAIDDDSVWASSVIRDYTVTDEQYYYVLQYLDLIPQNVTQDIIDAGWKVLIHPANTTTLEDGNHVHIGETNYDVKTVQIYCNNKAAIDQSVLHEMGHVIFDMYSIDDDLKAQGITTVNDGGLSDIYLHTADGSLYIYSNFGEMMATYFREYLLYPKETEAQTPEIYSIYKKALA